MTGQLSFEPFLNGRRGYVVTADLALYLHTEPVLPRVSSVSAIDDGRHG